MDCSNVHFHAHRDGSTTVHRHRACPKSSYNQQEQEQDDLSDQCLDMAAILVKKKLSQNSTAIITTSDFYTDLSEFSLKVENDRYMGVRGFTSLLA